MPKSYDNRLTQDILDRLNLVDVASSYVQLKKSGSNYKGLCPFHQEKSPSFMVSEDKQLYHCFGCGVGGDVFNLVMGLEHVDFKDALGILAERAGLNMDDYREKRSPEDDKLQKLRGLIFQMNREAAIAFYKALAKSPEALAYLKKRGIAPDVAKRFGLGYAPAGWQFMTDQLLKRYDREAVLGSGLVLEGKNDRPYDRFRDRLMFPIIDVRGRILGFGGRVMGDDVPKYLNSPETPVFDKGRTLYGLNIAKDHLRDRRLVITEGYMDVIGLHQAGVRNVVATLGTALTEGHGRLIKRYADEVILAYDGDEAGQKAALRGIEILRSHVPKIKVLVLPKGKDPDDVVREEGLQAFTVRLEAAPPYMIYLMDRFLSETELKDETDLVDYLEKLKPYFKALGHEIEKKLYVDALAERTNLGVGVLFREIYGHAPVFDNRPRGINEAEPPGQQRVKPRKTPRQKLEEKVLTLCLHDRRLYEELLSTYDLGLIADAEIRSVILSLHDFYTRGKVITIEALSELFDLEILQRIEPFLKEEVELSEDDYQLVLLMKRLEIERTKEEIIEIQGERQRYEALKKKRPEDTALAESIQSLFVRETALKQKKYKAERHLEHWKGGRSIE